ncbi:hypothetical protein VTO42DRAFT_6358 [Malbranchea cinnamomea]
MDVLTQHLWSIPPVTRTLFAGMFIESLLVHGGFLSFYRVLFHSPFIFRWPPQLWRLVTPYLLTGGGLGFLFDLYLLYNYGTGLELDSPRFINPGDFAVYVAFVWVAIMLPAGFLLKAYVFTRALLSAFVYAYAQDNRGRRVTFFIMQIPVELLPWVMLFVTFLSAGWEAVLLECCGIFAAHLYDFLTRLYPTFGGGTNLIRTPDFVRRCFHPRQPVAAHGGYRFFPPANRPAPQPQQRTGIFSSGSSWSQRGPGRRLGGD